MTPTTEAQPTPVATIRAELAAATPWPWHLNQPDYSTVILGTDGYPLAHADGAQKGRNQGHANARLIAHAPEWLAELCDRLGAAEGEVERLRKALRKIGGTSVRTVQNGPWEPGRIARDALRSVADPS